MAPVPVLLRRPTTRPSRRDSDTRVTPLLPARPVAPGGELILRPARAVRVFARTPKVDAAEDDLQRAILAAIAGTNTLVSTADVAEALCSISDISSEEFSVHGHMPEKFLIFFADRAARNRVLLDGSVQTPSFRLVLSPWSRRAHSSAGGLGFTSMSRLRDSRLMFGAWRRRRTSWRRPGGSSASPR